MSSATKRPSKKDAAASASLLIGYARVSTEDQKLDLQKDALVSAGCDRIFEDRASGARTERPGLREALSHLRRGDTLVVWKLDRLGRTTHQLVGLLEQFEQDGVKLRSLQDGIDPSTTMGKAMLQIGAVFAEMERNLIRERTRAGLAAARARGRLGGRKQKIGKDAVDTARRLMKDPDLTMSEIAQRLGVNRVTLYRTLEREADFRPRAPGRKPGGKRV
ncbi:recombinase family protein [Lichenihabitans psoromatis]|uniref:recombinase family protein n=1 Tax=Lichenihabitans psoromatis TaxID=2528642 RepID=UPI003CCB2617